VLDINSGLLQRITNQNYLGVSNPSFCEDGKTVLFNVHEYKSGSSVDVVMTVDSSLASPVPKKVTNGAMWGYSVHSKQIAYIEDRKVPYDYEVWKMNPDGSKQKQITNMHSYIYNPVFTPDGKKIMFISDPKRDNLPELWQISANGGKPRKLAGSELFYSPLSWKP
jgi:TolB protein